MVRNFVFGVDAVLGLVDEVFYVYGDGRVKWENAIGTLPKGPGSHDPRESLVDSTTLLHHSLISHI
jgi:hypothetical protein